MKKDPKRDSKAGGYEPGEVLTLFRRGVESAIGAKDLCGITVSGTLGQVPPSRGYAKIYGAQLSGEGGDLLELAIPRGLEQQARSLEHQHIVVRGDLEIDARRAKISCRLEARKLYPAAATNTGGAGETTPGGIAEGTSKGANDARSESGRQSVVSILKSVRRRARPFPYPGPGGRLAVAVISPRSGVVLSDFRRQLGASDGVDVKPISVAITDQAAIVRGIEASAHAPVAVLIRGGGDPAEFRTFDDPAVIKAWASHPSYTVSALGHAEDTALLDLVSDQALDTPTAAGAYVWQQVTEGLFLDDGQVAGDPGSTGRVTQTKGRSDQSFRNDQVHHIEPAGHPERSEGRAGSGSQRRATPKPVVSTWKVLFFIALFVGSMVVLYQFVGA